MVGPKHRNYLAHFTFGVRPSSVVAAALFATLWSNIPVTAQQASTQSSTDQKDAAMKAFEAALQRDPTNAQAREGEVKAAIAAALQAKRAGDNDGALVYLVRARKYIPDDPTLLFDFGVQADGMRLYKDAEEALTKSLKLRPG